MKKNFRLLAIIVLTICLAGFTFDQIIPTNMVHAASENCPELSSTNPSEKKAVSLSLSTQPVVFVAAGLVCVLVGIIAITPLLIDDPVLRREAGIYIRGSE